MDAEELRRVAIEARRELLNGRSISREHVTAEPSPEGFGYLLHSRGFSWHRQDVDEIVQAFIQELRK